MNKEAEIALIALCTVLALVAWTGYAIGTIDTEQSAIEYGCAEYNKTTGEFQYIERTKK